METPTPKTAEELKAHVKAMRVSIDAILQTHNNESYDTGGVSTEPQLYSLACNLVREKLIEAKMWSGKILEALGSELPVEFRDKANVTTTQNASQENTQSETAAAE
jgi:hypothetical protein